MSEQIIELAIRGPRPGQQRSFDHRKRALVDALLAVPGVGPERAFVAFGTVPEIDAPQHVGMTRYADKAAQKRATMNLAVLRRLVGFMRVMRPHVGVFLKPDDPDFDLATFASDPGCAVEFAALVPADGVSQETFTARRDAFLEALDEHPAVLRSHTFTTAGGLKAKDSLVHVTVYRDRPSLEALAAELADAPAFTEFRETFGTNLIAFAAAA